MPCARLLGMGLTPEREQEIREHVDRVMARNGVPVVHSAMAEPAPETTDEQLENMCLALGLPTLPVSMRPLFWRESMLNLHRLVQRSLDGDARAGLVVERL